MSWRGLARNKVSGVLGAGLVVLALVACSSPSQSQDEQTSSPAGQPAAPATVAAPASSASAASQPSDDDAVIERVSAVIKKHHLTSLQEECIDYMVDSSDGATVDIDVHEKHDEKCGGDPNTSPRLFSFKLDRASGQLTTDALDLADGDFQPIE